MKNYLESLKNKNIIIEDNTKLNLGFSIRKHPFIYTSLMYRNNRFLINTVGIWCNVKEAKQYSKELIETSKIVEKLNILINKKK